MVPADPAGPPRSRNGRTVPRFRSCCLLETKVSRTAKKSVKIIIRRAQEIVTLARRTLFISEIHTTRAVSYYVGKN